VLRVGASSLALHMALYELGVGITNFRCAAKHATFTYSFMFYNAVLIENGV
jgi:hypothetical protein